MVKILLPIIALSAANAVSEVKSERINEFVILPGHTKKNHIISPLPHT